MKLLKTEVPTTILELTTENPDLTVSEITREDMDGFIKLAQENERPLTAVKLQVPGLIDMARQTAEGLQPEGAKRMAIKLGGVVVGAVFVGEKEPHTGKDVSISYFVDKSQYKKGVARAAVSSVVDYINGIGLNAVAEVSRDNVPSTALLKKVGFSFDRYDFDEGEVIYRRDAPHSSDKIITRPNK